MVVHKGVRQGLILLHQGVRLLLAPYPGYVTQDNQYRVFTIHYKLCNKL